MVSLYVKAGVITLAIFLLGMFIVKYVDDQRLGKINEEVRQVIESSESTKLLFLYLQTEQSVNKSVICPVLEQRTKAQVEKAYVLVSRLQEYGDANVVANYDEVKTRYILANTELWLYVLQSKKLCDTSYITPVLFFYSDKVYCQECIVQGEILDKVISQCKDVRVFAFPYDLDVGILDLIKARYNVTKVPMIVINERQLTGLQSESGIKEELNC